MLLKYFFLSYLLLALRKKRCTYVYNIETISQYLFKIKTSSLSWNLNVFSNLVTYLRRENSTDKFHNIKIVETKMFRFIIKNFTIFALR